MTRVTRQLWLLGAVAVCGFAGSARAQEPAPDAAVPAEAAPSEATSPAPAAPPRSVGLLVRMGLSFGGAELAKVEWDDGSDGKIKAGQLFTFAAGVLFRPAGAPVALEGTVGYQFDRVNGSNGSVKFTRFPVDALLSYTHGGHRLGAGATAHLAPRFSCDIASVCDASASYGTAFGGLAQYVYGFGAGKTGGLELGVRYTVLKYSGSGLETVDGSGLGLLVGARF